MSDYQMPPKEVNLSQPVESDEETIDLLDAYDRARIDKPAREGTGFEIAV